MSRSLLLSAFALLCASQAAWAEPTAVVVGQNGRPGDTNINLQTTGGSYCAAQPTSNCGTCSISCPSGKSAMCKPGIAVNPKPGASCLTPPECSCR